MQLVGKPMVATGFRMVTRSGAACLTWHATGYKNYITWYDTWYDTVTSLDSTVRCLLICGRRDERARTRDSRVITLEALAARVPAPGTFLSKVRILQSRPRGARLLCTFRRICLLCLPFSLGFWSWANTDVSSWVLPEMLSKEVRHEDRRQAEGEHEKIKERKAV